jgi:hypothetical protein
VVINIMHAPVVRLIACSAAVDLRIVKFAMGLKVRSPLTAVGVR